MTDLYISVGIDVGADFSFMSIALPNQTFVGKPFRITHSNLNSLETAVSKIKEAEESNSLKARIFLESTGIYHYPLFCYLRDKGFNIAVINPIITNNSTNLNIRKVHNDKFDSKKLALIDLKTSVIPSDLVLNIRNLVREYYRLKDKKSAYVNKLTAVLKVSFPEYLGVFSKITVKTSLVLLEKYPSPDSFLSARKSSVIKLIRTTACFGEIYAENQYNKIISAAKSAEIFGHSLPSDSEIIRLYISFIRTYDNAADSIMQSVKTFVESNPDELFVIGISKNGIVKNPVLRSYYDKKCLSKPKMVALSAVIHKLCNIIFAILRDNKPFEIISPEQHNLSYHLNQISVA